MKGFLNLLYPQDSALPNPHQRSFIMNHSVVKKKTYNLSTKSTFEMLSYRQNVWIIHILARYNRKQEDCKSRRQWMTLRNQHFRRNIQMYIWTHRDCYKSTQYLQAQSRQKLSGEKLKVLPHTKEIWLVESSQERKSQFSSIGWHGVYKLHSRAGLTPGIAI